MLVYRELKGIKPLSACEVTTKVPIRHIRAFMSCLKLLLIACVWVGFKSMKKKKEETLMEIHRSEAISRFIFSWPHKKEAAASRGCVGCLNRNFGK